MRQAIHTIHKIQTTDEIIPIRTHNAIHCNKTTLHPIRWTAPIRAPKPVVSVGVVVVVVHGNKSFHSFLGGEYQHKISCQKTFILKFNGQGFDQKSYGFFHLNNLKEP
jgi:hypothetical protein